MRGARVFRSQLLAFQFGHTFTTSHPAPAARVLRMVDVYVLL